MKRDMAKRRCHKCAAPSSIAPVCVACSHYYTSNYKEKAEQKKNLYSRSMRVSMNDLGLLDKTQLIMLLIELHITISDLGDRMKASGDNWIDSMNAATGNKDMGAEVQS